MGRAVHDFTAALDVQQYVLTGRDLETVVSTSWDEIDRNIRSADFGDGPGPFTVVEFNVAEGWARDVSDEFEPEEADDQTIYNALHDRLSSQADADYQARKEAF